MKTTTNKNTKPMKIFEIKQEQEDIAAFEAGNEFNETATDAPEACPKCGEHWQNHTWATFDECKAKPAQPQPRKDIGKGYYDVVNERDQYKAHAEALQRQVETLESGMQSLIETGRQEAYKLLKANNHAEALVEALADTAKTLEAELLKCPESSYIALSEVLIKSGKALAAWKARRE